MYKLVAVLVSLRSTFAMQFVSLLVVSNVLYAPPRMVVGEMFTNTSCGPCVAANNTLNQIAYDCQRYLAVIRYHTWWPGSYDPFYRANIGENTTRTQFYGTNYVPRFYVDGNIDGGSSHSSWRALVDNRSYIDSPLRIQVTARYRISGNPAWATAKIVNETSSPITGRLHFILTETGIYWPAPNGSTMHNHTMLDMIPDASGELVTIPAGDSITRQRDFVIRDTTWLNPPTNTQFHLTRRDSCEIIVFLQDQNTKEIYQAGKSSVLPEVGIEETHPLTTSIKSAKVYPNPFITAITIHNPSSKVNIYNVSGRLIKSFFNTNTQELIWDGRNEFGTHTKPGVYFIETTNTRVKVLKCQ